MQIVYLNHSGFLIETDDKKAIVIDYFGDTDNGAGYLHDLFLKDYSFYFLSSHHHQDHFDREILGFDVKDKTYVLSEDIVSSGTLDKTFITENMHFIDKTDEFDDGKIKIKACGSTDQGISFIISVDGKTIFHAGDLNNWHWTLESTEAEVRAASRFFKRELDYIHSQQDCFDAVMFPVDPRMGLDFGLGALQFVQRIKTDIFIPMHYWNLKDEAMEFGDELLPYINRFVTIEDKGQIILLD